MKNIILSLLLVLSLAACDNKQEQSSQNEKPTIKVGIVSPLSSGMQREAYEMQAAMIYIANKYNNTNMKYELIFEDSAGQASKAISAAKKLIDVDHVDVIVSHLSAISKVISPLATKANILHIGTVIDADLENNPTSFTFWTSADKKAEKYVQYLKSNKVKNLAILVLNQATTEKLYQSLEKALIRENIKYTKYNFAPNQKDYRLDLAKIKMNNHDMSAFLIWAPELDIVGKQYKELGIETPVSAIESLPVANNKELFEGDFFVDTYPGDEVILNEIKIGAKTSGTYAFATLNDLLAMVHSINVDYYKKNNRKSNGKEMTEALLKQKEYYGASGQITINQNRKIEGDVSLMQVKKGQLVVVE